MKLKAAKIAFGVRFLVFSSLIPVPLWAQATATLSGTTTDESGKVVPNAQISVKNLETGQSIETQTNAAGVYSVPSLAPGNYTISVSARGFAAKAASITLTGAISKTLDLVLTAASSARQTPAPATAPPHELPNAPAPPSLGDLGFTAQQTQANPKLQAMLEKRTEMLKVHQRLGLITVAPLVATLITGPMAKAKGRNGQTIKEPTTANLDFHAALGGATTGLYFATAYYAVFAPRVPGIQKHGAIRFHEALAFIHGPGMILTPVLGIMAYKQENAGEKVHGIASAHGAVAYTTAAAYGAAIVAVSWPIHMKFWEKR